MTSAYFNERKKFLPMALAGDIRHGIAIGPFDSWWTYDGGVWRESRNEVERRVTRKLHDDYTDQYKTRTEKNLRWNFGIPEIPVTPEGVGTGMWNPEINVKNGVLNWQTGTLSAHDPARLDTIQAGFTYDPEATSPHFDAWLERVAPGEENALALEALGYSLLVGNPLQKAIVLLGGGRNGKSTFINILEELAGKENGTNISLHSLAMNNFAPAGLFMKSFNALADVGDRYVERTGTLKGLLGGDSLMCERKGKDAFPFQPFASLYFSTNSLWRAGDSSEGYFRRWTFVPFGQKIDKSAPFSWDKIRGELPGIANRALEALRRVHKQDGFTLTAGSAEVHASFRTSSDNIGEWLDGDDTVTADPENGGLFTDGETLHAAYAHWCAANGITRSVASRPVLVTALGERGFEGGRKSVDNKQKRGVIGISVSPGGATDPEGERKSVGNTTEIRPGVFSRDGRQVWDGTGSMYDSEWPPF